ncbi:unnamed protein product [Coffea canephora]|uniref:Inhibitor I9 domain-containing protein n=1 Tax=Coffea canephora TaxID=49390 RepID=A0A068V227_COFCA|nr:unnamed protein product [Coffea canephora]
MAISSNLPLLPAALFLLLLPTSSVLATERDRKTFIVRVRPDAKPSIFPTHQHWYESSLTSLLSSHHSTAATATPPPPPPPPPPLLHTYSTVFHGFSAQLTVSQAHALHSFPGILAVIPEQVRQLHTTRSPQFLGLKTSDSAGLLKESDFGSDLVIAVIDTGIWLERKSFDDRDLGLVPPKWKGACVPGRDFLATSCNRKLIGARYFSNGYEATNGKMNETTEYRSPRDSDGHGTHTASIAAGRYGLLASEEDWKRWPFLLLSTGNEMCFRFCP